MMTLVGVRRRGFTPESLRLFAERIGVSKADSWIEMGVLEQAVRDDLDAKAPRAVAVLKPLKLIIDNYPEGQTELCFMRPYTRTTLKWDSASSVLRVNCGLSKTIS